MVVFSAKLENDANLSLLSRFSFSWCGKYRSEVLKLRVLVGSHSPSQFRVVGPMSNIEAFSDSFKCAPGTKMNPTNKCSI
jgi:endothelin-converting enzyme